MMVLDFCFCSISALSSLSSPQDCFIHDWSQPQHSPGSWCLYLNPYVLTRPVTMLGQNPPLPYHVLRCSTFCHPYCSFCVSCLAKYSLLLWGKLNIQGGQVGPILFSVATCSLCSQRGCSRMCRTEPYLISQGLAISWSLGDPLCPSSRGTRPYQQPGKGKAILQDLV